MFILCAEKNRLSLQQGEPLTSGSAGVYQVLFRFSPDWDGLSRTACFRSGGQSACVLLDESGTCTVPWELTALESEGRHLFAGVWGSDASGVVLPTVWADCGVILQGAAAGAEAAPPTPGLLEQALERKADGIEVEGLELRLLSGDRPLACVRLPPAGGAGGEAATEEEVNQMLNEVFGPVPNTTKKEENYEF
ncbi:MAG: hypothetical protein HFF52_04490 [Lawsonibacter sp.]|nr:hypothetical protein [Lawsonibacter sp.]